MISVSLRTIVITVILVSIIIPTSYLGYTIIQDRTETLGKINNIILKEATKVNEDKIELFFSERISDMEVVSKTISNMNDIDLLFSKNYSNDPKKIPQLDSYLNNVLTAYNYESIWILDSNFKPIYVIGEDSTIYEESKKSHFKDENKPKMMSSHIFISDIIIEPEEGRTMMLICKAISKNDSVLGYLVFDIDVSPLLNNILGDLSKNYLAEEIITQIQNDKLVIVKAEENSRINNISIIHQDELEGNQTPEQDAANGLHSNGYVVDVNGEDVLAHWTYSHMVNWGIVSKINTNEMFIGHSSMILNLVIIITGLIIAAIFAGLIIYRYFQKPLKEILFVTNKIAHEHYDSTINVSGPKEYQQISSAFNKMISSIKKEKETVQVQFKELEKIDTQKAEFAAMAAHELKTPLVPIKGYLEMLMEPGLIGDLSKEQRELLKNIQEDTETLEKLIKKVLSAQRIEIEQIKWNLSKFNVTELIDEVYSDNRKLCNDKQIHFSKKETPSITITSDFEHLKEVFSNLIQNAVDFTDKDGKIEIGCNEKNDFVEFFVKDTGIGIDKEHQKHLFKKFYQVDTSLRRKHGGTGLGLAICKGLVEGLKGMIWVQSEKGKGTTFYFKIPRNNDNRQ